MPLPVIAIFDIGKTNKKLFLFDEQYKIVYEKSARFIETEDEDGFPCENLESLQQSVYNFLGKALRKKTFDIKSINFTTYGASLVYIDAEGKKLTPLYNYLKPYPATLKEKFYKTYGGEEQFSQQTASPVLGSLNSGMQLYRIKYEKPQVFEKIKYALHLPQYMSYLISGKTYSDITSIGCHTNFWNFKKNEYHEWVSKEKIIEKLAPILPADKAIPTSFAGYNYQVGIGLHDTSAALIPYLASFHEPFILLSTGTWCISMNPFNQTPLTPDELKNDCLCYFNYKGKPVKASRLFAGYEHDQEVKRIAGHFNKKEARFKSIQFDASIVAELKRKNDIQPIADLKKNSLRGSVFSQRDISVFNNDVQAYHQFILDLVAQQFTSTKLVLNGANVKRIFVDGGFSRNSVYMNLLASVFPGIEVCAASVAQATAVGAAMAIHSSWNKKPFPKDMIDLKYYSHTHDIVL